MNHLWDKYQESQETAEFLIENQRYGSSIHCSYYSCYQLILYLIEYHKDSITQGQPGTQPNGHIYGSHNQTIHVITNLIRRKDENEATTLYQRIMTLKQLRVKADYANKPINANDSRRANRMATEIIDQLTQYTDDLF